jgi:hypothetical protein
MKVDPHEWIHVLCKHRHEIDETDEFSLPCEVTAKSPSTNQGKSPQQNLPTLGRKNISECRQ